MNILILGGHGFLASHLVKHLASPHYDVVPLSRRDGLDLTDYSNTKQCFAEQKPAIIINLASHGGSLHYVTDYAADVIHDNIQMTLNIYRATTEVCRDARIINPLSNCSYPGNQDIQSELAWWEGEVHDSVYSYGNSKRFIYVVARCYQKQYGIKSVNFLVPNTFGPGDSTDPNKTHALNGMIIRMIKAHRNADEQFEIWGTGTPVREWAYVGDVVAILTLGISMNDALTYPVNIAREKGFSINQSAAMIAESVGYTGRLIFNTKYQDGDLVKILDATRFRELFPNFQFFDHQTGIQETVDYYQSVL